jgi:hypothetical protein
MKNQLILPKSRIFFSFSSKMRYSEEMTHWQQDRLPPEPMRTYIHVAEKRKKSADFTQIANFSLSLPKNAVF